MSWLSYPQLANPEAARQGRLVISVLRTMVVLTAFGVTAAQFDPVNRLSTTLLFYGPVLVAVLSLGALVQRGRVVAAAWSISIFFWLLTASVTLFFGGLKGENAAVFGVATMLIGTIVGGRAAVSMAIASSVWCAAVGTLEHLGRLPPQLGPYSILNAWTAISVSLLLMAVLVKNSLDSLGEMHARAEANARDRDEALKRSVQAQKMELVGNLASGVAHDFNNLLTVITCASVGLRSQEPAHTPAVKEALDDIDAATTRAVLMTRQLLSFGKTQEFEQTVLDLGEVVRSLGAFLPRLLGARIAMSVEAGEAAPVRATRVGLEQVLLNLAVNARDAMPGGGDLKIAVHAAGERVVLSVSDSGGGMSAATRARIFEPFFTTKAQGTGLGLATVKDHVVRYGGSLDVRSTEGVGTVFEVSFPLVAEGLARSPLPSAGPAPGDSGATLRVLLVDDDALVRRSTARLLELGGYSVEAVADGYEALAALARSDPFGCVVSDLVMPNLDGVGLEAAVTQRYPRLPMVLMSGNTAAPEASLRGPRRAFVTKPLDRVALSNAIERVTRAESF